MTDHDWLECEPRGASALVTGHPPNRGNIRSSQPRTAELLRLGNLAAATGGGKRTLRPSAMLITAIVAVAFWSAGADRLSSTATLDPDEQRRLQPGDVVVSVEASTTGSGAHILAVIDIPRPPHDVWSVMTDCARAPSFVPNLVSCRILERARDGSWDIREQVSSLGWLSPNFRSVFRSEYEPDRRVHVSRVAGDMIRSEGEWLLVPIQGGRATRVTYSADVDYGSWLPNFLIRDHVVDDIRTVLSALRRACLVAQRN